MGIYSSGKRIFDFTIAFIVLLILWPVFLCIAIFIKLDSKGPVFFKQRRIGKDKQEFSIIKFRTMKIETPKEVPTHLLENPDVYITRVGKLLRKTSLDELPQVFNILKGDMSMVGPRPALWNQFDLITERDKYGCNQLYPGLTGWAQVNGRDELSIEEKANFDGEYVNNISLLFDINILFLTVIRVVRRRGVKEGKLYEIINYRKE
ncbi:sugar transferase [Bacillus sp. OK048]|uniref:sugar transferase n=1 Tax=Bacillus sp. OK048 TaxID=1882761 RepID=UPI0008831517|nr:sugar transferase [Bacillus sp. OK048]SDN57005.1 O-antigen biosynthesis protein WbqP [Bacillus sp. OK048]